VDIEFYHLPVDIFIFFVLINWIPARVWFVKAILSIAGYLSGKGIVLPRYWLGRQYPFWILWLIISHARTALSAFIQGA
jgi:hypothetical protein